jgi:hypothetical protein
VKVYLLEGSEDGCLGVYGSARYALQEACNYVACDYTSELLRELRLKGFITVQGTTETTADVTEHPVL